MQKNNRLKGKKIRSEENKVAIFTMIRKNLVPSLNSFILLLPVLAVVRIGIYFTLLPLRRYPMVRVVG
jgi:hypothetical protein